MRLCDAKFDVAFLIYYLSSHLENCLSKNPHEKEGTIQLHFTKISFGSEPVTPNTGCPLLLPLNPFHDHSCHSSPRFISSCWAVDHQRSHSRTWVWVVSRESPEIYLS